MNIPLPLVPLVVALRVVLSAAVFILRVAVVPLVEYLLFLAGQIIGFGLSLAKKSVRQTLASE